MISDVKGSTEALLRGKYKDINAIAVAMIVAVRNCFSDTELPFVFGGDGATICVPPGNEELLSQCLTSCQQRALSLQLELRIALIPATTLYAAGQTIGVSKLKVSPHYQQACFSGGGMRYAEKILKDPVLNQAFLIENAQPNADYSGFECRWSNVTSRHGETLSLIIEASSPQQYELVLQHLQQITGGREHYHPIASEQLSFAWSPARLATEINIRTETKSLVSRFRYYLHLVFMNLIGGWLMSRKIKTDATDWGAYKQDFIANCDFIKFEDGLKMCISCTPVQREAIIEYLSSQEQAGQITFGIHVASAALITCMITAYQSEHIHFIDGADGGYSLAALNLKNKRTTRPARR